METRNVPKRKQPKFLEKNRKPPMGIQHTPRDGFKEKTRGNHMDSK